MSTNIAKMVDIELNSRVKQIRKVFKLSQKEFASKIGLSASHLGQIEVNKTNPTSGTLGSVIKAFSINGTWLLTGEGEIFDNQPVSITQIKDLNATNISGDNNNISIEKVSNPAREYAIEIEVLKTEILHLREQLRLQADLIDILKKTKGFRPKKILS